MTDELLITVTNGVGSITLNRPQALNAINPDMYEGLMEHLSDWAENPDIRLVLIEGAGERAFSAGGDIRYLYDCQADGDLQPLIDLFRLEYTMDRLINRYPKPYVALIDGLVMGGGAGVSVHGTHRVVTDHSRFAMPETGIGFFPDIGASWFLSRCPGNIGLYLGLTGTLIGGADMVYCGLADTYVPRDRLPRLRQALIEGGDVDTATRELSEDPGEPSLSGIRDAIDSCFGKGSPADILAALEKSPDAWATEAQNRLRAQAPFSLEVAFRSLRLGASLSIEDCMTMEFRLCRRFLDRPELYEGVRAQVIDKDRTPDWTDKDLTGVDLKQVESFFEPLKNDDLLFYNN